MRKYIVLTFLSIVLLLAACGKKSYEVDEELAIDFTGYDEYGAAEVSIDSDVLSTNLRKIKGVKNEEEAHDFNQLMDSIVVEVTPNENLKNGDKVDVKLSYDEENSFKFKLALKNSQYEVVDLKPTEVLSQEDVFSNITINYAGVSPFLRVGVRDESGGELSSLFEYQTNTKYLSNGDEFEITAEPTKDLPSNGYKVDEADLSKKATVSDQPKLVESWEELKKEDQEYVLEEIEKVVVDEFERPLDSVIFSIFKKGEYEAPGNLVDERGETEVAENYFLSIDEDQYVADEKMELNSIRIVYQKELVFGTSHAGNEYSDQTITVYSAIGASHLILDKDGNLLRDELTTKQYAKTDMDLETVEESGINRDKDKYQIKTLK